MVEGEYAPRPPEIAKKSEKERGVLPISEVAKRVGLSTHRIRRLLNTGRVKGWKVRKDGRGYPWRWLTTRRAVEKYKSFLKSPREYGKRGGRPRKRKAAVA